MLTAAGTGAGCTYMVRGLGKRADVSFAFACGYPAAVIVLHAETTSDAVLPSEALPGRHGRAGGVQYNVAPLKLGTVQPPGRAAVSARAVVATATVQVGGVGWMVSRFTGG